MSQRKDVKVFVATEYGEYFIYIEQLILELASKTTFA